MFSRITSESRLKLALGIFFLCLSVPAFLLAYRAYQQAQWEVFHGFRLQAEALSARLDADLRQRLANEDARTFIDYAFAVGGGARSPLAAFPTPQTLPGLVGYFQVDSAGRVSTPVLPNPDDQQAHGLDAEEYAARQALDARLRAALEAPAIGIGARRDAPASPAPSAAAGKSLDSLASADTRGNLFERLTNVDEGRQRTQQSGDYGTVADLKLDQRLEKKSREQRAGAPEPASGAAFAPLRRESRKEQVAVLEAEQDTDQMADDNVVSIMTPRSYALADQPARAVAGASSQSTPREETATERTARAKDLSTVRVRLFESELEPMKFERLDADHFLLFRNVWRDGSRYVQGAVIEQSAFLNGMIVDAWRGSALAAMSNLLIAWRGEVLSVGAPAAAAADERAGGLRGELLYRTRLSAPLAELELIYSVTELPLGASIAYLGWVTLALIVILAGGCFSIYRFALGQMCLFRQQQDFVSAVSHELKTPLTSIRMYSEMLKAGWADDDRKATYYEFIHDESERLSRLIENVLQLARMNRGQTRLELKPATIDSLFALLENKLASQVAQAGFVLHAQIEGDTGAALVKVDEDALVQILINFVDNAIKFTPADAPQRIELSAASHGEDSVRLSVRDYGPGVPKPQMRRIFELFYRAENELTRDTVGTGIGLALVRQLAGAMHTRVDVSNRDPGAEFSLTLPRAPSPT